MHLFYDPNISADLTFHTLQEEESKHCIRVLRLGHNETIHIADGRGSLFVCRIEDPNPKRCSVRIDNIVADFGSHPYSLHMAVGPTKNMERYEWFVEKAVEIGVDGIIPVISFQSERRTLKTERLERIAAGAMKQSLKATMPTIEEPLSFNQLIKRPFDGDKFIAHCNDDNERILLKDIAVKGNDTLILIGPEGDFSTEEVEAAKKNGFKSISLGDMRLRTETAAIAALHTIALINQ